MTQGTASAVQKQKPTLEDEVFRLKIEWMMAKTDEEKRRISDQIRGKLGLIPKKG